MLFASYFRPAAQTSAFLPAAFRLLVEGLNFAAQYQGKNDRDGAYESNGDGFGLSATYEYEGFGVGAAYAKSDRTNNQVKAARPKKSVLR